MSTPIDPDLNELRRRIERDLIDSYDEALELELEDQAFEAPGTEPAAPATEADKKARQQYFNELFRLQG
jgi:hypothetical protein